MTENEISYKIKGTIFKVYNELGPGLLESVYVAVLIYEFNQLDLKVFKEVPVPV
jgi:GxxExxY protein